MSWFGESWSNVTSQISERTFALAETIKTEALKAKEHLQQEHEKCSQAEETSTSMLLLPWDDIDVPACNRARVKEQSLKVSRNPDTFLIPPPDDVDWHFTMDAAHADLAQRLLKIDASLQKSRYSLVRARKMDGKVLEREFWRNYFYRISIILDSAGKVDREEATTSVSSDAESSKLEPVVGRRTEPPVSDLAPVSGVLCTGFTGLPPATTNTTEDTDVGAPIELRSVLAGKAPATLPPAPPATDLSAASTASVSTDSWEVVSEGRDSSSGPSDMADALADDILALDLGHTDLGHTDLGMNYTSDDMLGAAMDLDFASDHLMNSEDNEAVMADIKRELGLSVSGR